MEKFSRSIACLVVLVLFLAAGEVTSLEEEKRTCESKSHGFKGRCLSDHNCGLVCRNEGFSQGKCRGFRGRCFCVRHC
ncbi:hypothetical protein ACS0TY_032280 [Phlomoides rotata]